MTLQLDMLMPANNAPEWHKERAKIIDILIRALTHTEYETAIQHIINTYKGDNYYHWDDDTVIYAGHSEATAGLYLFKQDQAKGMSKDLVPEHEIQEQLEYWNYDEITGENYLNVEGKYLPDLAVFIADMARERGEISVQETINTALSTVEAE